MRQLVMSWITAHKAGYRNTLPDAIGILNRECGTQHDPFPGWLSGALASTRRRRRFKAHMLYWALPWALREVGIQATEAQLDALEDLLWTVTTKDGERHIELL